MSLGDGPGQDCFFQRTAGRPNSWVFKVCFRLREILLLSSPDRESGRSRIHPAEAHRPPRPPCTRPAPTSVWSPSIPPMSTNARLGQLLHRSLHLSPALSVFFSWATRLSRSSSRISRRDRTQVVRLYFRKLGERKVNRLPI